MMLGRFAMLLSNELLKPMYTWQTCLDACAFAPASLVAAVVGVSRRAIERYQRGSRGRRPEHAIARAIADCADHVLHRGEETLAPGLYDYRRYGQPWRDLVGCLVGRGYTYRQFERFGLDTGYTWHVAAGNRTRLRLPHGEALLRAWWSAQGGTWCPRGPRKPEYAAVHPGDVLPPLVW